MSSKINSRHTLPPWEMSRMESRLEATLHGVAPRPDFVSNLRSRLNTPPNPRPSGAELAEYVIITLGAVVGAGLLIVTGVKAVVALLSVLGMIHQVSRGRSERARASTEV